MEEMLKVVLMMVPGAALAVGGYVAYVTVKKGVPAAKAMVTTWWNKGKAEAAALKGDVASAHSRLDKLESDMGAVKAKVGL